MLSKIKTISMIVFLGILSWGAFTLTKEIQATLHNVNAISLAALAEVQDLKVESLKRIDEVGEKSFLEVRDTRAELLARVDKINIDLNKTTTSLSAALDNIAVTTENVNRQIAYVEPFLDCTSNDLCLQNNVIDMAIDSRQVARETTKSLLVAQKEIPRISYNIAEATNSISNATESLAASTKTFSEGMPEIVSNTTQVTENVSQITNHIQQITKPKWYHRVINYAVSGSFLWYNLNKNVIEATVDRNTK